MDISKALNVAKKSLAVVRTVGAVAIVVTIIKK